jgi:PAS domain S-box-containing protein
MSALTAPSGLPQHDLTRVLAQVVECAPNGVVLTRSDGSILLVNAELERMFGYTRSQLFERPIERLVPERFRAGHAALRGELAEDGRSRAMGTGRELIGLRADGSELPIEVGLSTLDTSEGVLAVESVVDISVRKRLERMFQRMVEAAPCSMLMIDGRGRIVLVNPQVEQMFGYARTELIGSPLEMLLPERLRATHCLHRRAFASGPSIRRMGVGRDLTARRKDGTEFPVEIGLSPVTSEDSGLVLATVSDLTHRTTVEPEMVDPAALIEDALDMQSQRQRFQVSVQNEAAPFVTERTPLEDRSIANLPLMREGVSMGCLTLCSDRPGYFNAHELRFFIEMARGVALVLRKFMK